MQVSLRALHGFPEDSILSVRVGSTRRQAKVSALKTNSLKFPQSADGCESIALDVHEVVASLRLVLVPQKDLYELQFDTSSKNNMLCSMSVSREVGVEGRSRQESQGSEADADVECSVAKICKDAASSARTYLENTQLLPYIQGLVHLIIQEKPEDPYSFLRKQLAIVTDAKAGGEQEKERKCAGAMTPASTAPPSLAASGTAAGSPLPARLEDVQEPAGVDCGSRQESAERLETRVNIMEAELRQLRARLAESLKVRKDLAASKTAAAVKAAAEKAAAEEAAAEKAATAKAAADKSAAEKAAADKSAAEKAAAEKMAVEEAAAEKAAKHDAAKEIFTTYSVDGRTWTLQDYRRFQSDAQDADLEIESVEEFTETLKELQFKELTSTALGALFDMSGKDAKALRSTVKARRLSCTTPSRRNSRTSEEAFAWLPPAEVLSRPAASVEEVRQKAMRMMEEAVQDGRFQEIVQHVASPWPSDEALQFASEILERPACRDAGSSDPQPLDPTMTQQTARGGHLSMDTSGLVLMHANDVAERGDVVCRSSGQSGTVLRRTTTDVLLQLADCSEGWHEVENVGQHAMLAVAHRALDGDAVALLSRDGVQGTVIQRTTTDLQVEVGDGLAEWHAVEDVAQVLPHPCNIKAGDVAVRLCDAETGIVVCRTTTDLLLRMSDGTESWHAAEDLGCSVLPPACRVEPVPHNASRLMLMDANAVAAGADVVCRSSGQSGTVLRRTTTDLLLRLADDTEAWHEVENVAQPAVLAVAHNAIHGEGVAVLPRACAQGTVIQRTTTDVQVQMEDGTSAWHAVEDVVQLLPEAHSAKDGDGVVRLADAAMGVVQCRTTTDALLCMVDGSKEWHGIEDIGRLQMPAGCMHTVRKPVARPLASVLPKGEAAVVKPVQVDNFGPLVPLLPKWETAALRPATEDSFGPTVPLLPNVEAAGVNPATVDSFGPTVPLLPEGQAAGLRPATVGSCAPMVPLLPKTGAAVLKPTKEAALAPEAQISHLSERFRSLIVDRSSLKQQVLTLESEMLAMKANMKAIAAEVDKTV